MLTSCPSIVKLLDLIRPPFTEKVTLAFGMITGFWPVWKGSSGDGKRQLVYIMVRSQRQLCDPAPIVVRSDFRVCSVLSGASS